MDLETEGRSVEELRDRGWKNGMREGGGGGEAKVRGVHQKIKELNLDRMFFLNLGSMTSFDAQVSEMCSQNVHFLSYIVDPLS